MQSIQNIFSPRPQYSRFRIVFNDMESHSPLMTEQNKDIADTVLRERAKLSHFIRRRVRNPVDAEDILQDVMYDFVRAYRLPEPIEQVSAWLFRVARNRIIDRFRKKKEEALPGGGFDGDEADSDYLDLVLPVEGEGPDAVYARSMLLEAMQQALDELPAQQREVFIAHELDGRSFKELSAETGISVNTLLSSKRYAVMFLRRRLQVIYDELDME
jgi:RNA polymerase sigma factor (sigma-70 family)